MLFISWVSAGPRELSSVSLWSQARSVCCWWFLLNMTRIEPLKCPAVGSLCSVSGLRSHQQLMESPGTDTQGSRRGRALARAQGTSPGTGFSVLKSTRRTRAALGRRDSINAAGSVGTRAPLNTGVPVPNVPACLAGGVPGLLWPLRPLGRSFGMAGSGLAGGRRVAVLKASLT